MINFRFHIVSLTAVFLALVIGIVMGVSVIDQGTVRGLERGLDTAERRANDVRSTNDDLRDQLGRWSDFAEQAGDELVEGRLDGVPVTIFTVAGADDDVLATLRGTVAASGAVVTGVVRLGERLNLGDQAATDALAEIVGAPTGAADGVRTAALDQLATETASGSGRLLIDMERAGYIDLDGPVDPATVVVSGARFLVVSSRSAGPANADIAVPFTTLLARRAEARVTAVEPTLDGDDGEDDGEDEREEAARFVAALRQVGDVRLSTVDNASDFRGRVATVLALAALGTGQVGHYGTGRGADRLLPELGR